MWWNKIQSRLINTKPFLWNFCIQLNACPALTPAFFNNTANGQKPVNEACRRFAPTNAVKNSQYGLWKTAKVTLKSIKLPATVKIKRSKFILTSLSLSLRRNVRRRDVKFVIKSYCFPGVLLLFVLLNLKARKGYTVVLPMRETGMFITSLKTQYSVPGKR